MEQFFYQCEKNGCFLEQYVYHIGSYHYNWHRELELMTVLRGELEVCIDGASHLLRDSDVILIGSNKGHATLARQPESVAMVLHIAPDLFREYYGDMDALQFTCCSEGGRKNERPFVLLRAHLASLMLSAQGPSAEEKLRFEIALQQDTDGIPPAAERDGHKIRPAFQAGFSAARGRGDEPDPAAVRARSGPARRAAACRRRYAPAARRGNVAPAQRVDAGSSADRRRSGEDPVGAVTVVFSSSLPF